MIVEKIEPRWSGAAIVAATGPSLTSEVAKQLAGQRVIAINDAYRLLPNADVLYACDGTWWKQHNGCRDFAGEKWSSYDARRMSQREIGREFGLRLVRGEKMETFSLDPRLIHYGRNSGFQAINLAILFGATPILLVGFNFKVVGGKRHFFGNHPRPLISGMNFPAWLLTMRKAAQALPPHIQIINCTPDSAIDCFPTCDLSEVINGLEARNAA